MVNGRNIFTYFANIFMLTVSLTLFLTVPGLAAPFTLLTIICLSLGGITTFLYIVMIKEKPLTQKALELDAAYKETMKAAGG
jgi:hypothetical protein